MNGHPQRGAAAIGKGLNLFLALVDDAGATPLSVLAEGLGIANSTAQRIVGAYLQAGLLSRVGRGRYAAGLKLGGLASAANQRSVLVRASRGPLRALARALATTVHLGVLEGDMVTYIVKEQGGGPDLLTSESIQLEAYCSGIGKVLLANLGEPALEAYLAAGPFVALTARTITDPVALRSELQRVSLQGHAHDDAEVQNDLYCLAVPVRGPDGAVVASLSASNVSDSWRDPASLLALKLCARRISASLGEKNAE